MGTNKNQEMPPSATPKVPWADYLASHPQLPTWIRFGLECAGDTAGVLRSEQEWDVLVDEFPQRTT